MKTFFFTLLSMTMLFVMTDGASWAQGFRRGYGAGPGGPKMRCVRMLFKAPADQLKSQLGLKDEQVTQLQAIRSNVKTKGEPIHQTLKLHREEMRKLMEQDIPEQEQVLKEVRQGRTLRGKLQEEKIKAAIKALKVLTAEQRTMLRQVCKDQAGHGWGRQGRGPRRGFHGPQGRGPEAVWEDPDEE
jgi:Spy/CpxP family protein refolding chaperone